MGAKDDEPGLASGRFTAGLLLVLWLSLEFICVVEAAPPAIVEENLPAVIVTPEAVSTAHPQPPAAKNTPKPGMPESAAETERPGQASASPKPAEPKPAEPSADFLYTIRPGDTLSSIAALFRIETSDLMHLNRLTPDSVLQVGQQIRIPNPFAAQVRELSQKVRDLSQRLEGAQNEIATLDRELKTIKARDRELLAINRELRYDVRILPWWRTATLTAATVSALMLIVTLIALFEWSRLRKRFIAVVEANESLRRLDQKYRLLLAKAELRLQQIYGRRRPLQLDSPEAGKLPEEFELERYNQELKQVLEAELMRLGVVPTKNSRRSRIREIFSSVGAPPAARMGR